MDDVATLDARWQAGYARAMVQVRAWRTAHPHATFTEIEAALDAQLQAVRADLLADLVAADPLTSLADCPVDERPVCAACGTTLVSVGQQTRQVRVAGDHSVPVTRSYARCPRCGRGHFPPG